MLIVLTGVETIHKKYFAYEMVGALNVFNIDGYDVVFSGKNTTVTNQQGEVVYRALETEEGPVVTKLFIDETVGYTIPHGRATFEKINTFSRTLYDIGKNNHFANVFANPLYDLGISNVFESMSDKPPNKLYKQPHTYADVLHNYNTRTFDNFIISGVFSKTFIENLRRDLGEENVTVVNILRSPSAAFLLNEKDDEYYQIKKPRTPLMDYRKFQTSLLNATIVSKMPGVINVRFEDILQDGSFELLGKTINLPPDHVNYNGVITQHEKDHIVAKNNTSEQHLIEFNQEYSSFEPHLFVEMDPSITLNDVKTAHESSGHVLPWNIVEPYFDIDYNVVDTFYVAKPPIKYDIQYDLAGFRTAHNNPSMTIDKYNMHFPMNVFEELGYQPAGYDDIVA